MLNTVQSPITVKTTTITIFSLLLLYHLRPTTSAPILGLDSFLTQQFQLDPHASNDTLPSLPSHLKSTLSTTATTTTLDHRITSLLSLSLPTSVHIKLVGPSFTPSSASTLSSFLSSSHSSSPFHVITPFDSTLHHLSLSHSLHHDASLSSPSLSSSLSSAIRASLASSTSSLRSSLLSVSYSVVDEIIAADFRREKPLHGYTVYLINLGAQSKPYAYTYSGSTGSELSSPSFTKCLGSVWVSKDRYIWVDLGAGPVDYGPGLSGDGVLPKGEFHPLAAFHGKAKSDKAVLADLASLVYSAYQILLVPSLRIPVPFENNLVVQFIHVVGSDGNDHNSYGLDWKSIENALSDKGLLLGDQSLSFKKYEINYKECALCSFAVSKSKSSYTSRFLFDNYTLIVSRDGAMIEAVIKSKPHKTSRIQVLASHFLPSSSSMASEKEAALAAASTPLDSPTIFDKIISKEIPANIVFEDEQVIAFRDINPQAPVHIVLIPKVKDGLSGLSKAEERHCEILGRLLYTAKLVAKQEGLDDGFRIVINDGPKGCQSVYHIHVHLLGGRQMNWPPG